MFEIKKKKKYNFNVFLRKKFNIFQNKICFYQKKNKIFVALKKNTNHKWFHAPVL